mmetsp:Transcript_33513/g.98761  ORF Transcript_33513/g.98761 Transcript_33513/m.98761 type:complete len:133 (-) Transcript_33513:53-451(-)
MLQLLHHPPQHRWMPPTTHPTMTKPPPMPPPMQPMVHPMSMQPVQPHYRSSLPHQQQQVVYSKNANPAKKPKMSLPDGYDNPTKINNWNCTQLERIIFEFGGKQRGNRDAKRGELRKLLEKYRKKAPTNNST